MTLIKTSVLTAISTVIKMITGFAINKVIAVYVGPSGLAFIGQLQNFIAISTTISNGAITNGVVKYTAEYSDEDDKKKLFSTSLKISIFSALFTALLIALFSNYISIKLFNSYEYVNVLYIFSMTIVFYSLNTLFLSILNGQREIQKYVIANISNSIIALVLVTLLTYFYNLKGALYALVINQSLVFFVTLFFLFRAKWFTTKYFNQKFDLKIASDLSSFSLMTIISIVSALGSILFIRHYIGTHFSWKEAGYWQAIIYISDAYLMIITMTLSVYYLPRFSEIKDGSELKKELFKGYRIIMPIVASFAFLVFILKSMVVETLFTKEFLPMLLLFKWQLIGDIVKIAGWILGYLFIAKAMAKQFIYTELIFSLSFILLSILFLESYGLIGVTYAFTINYLLYFITMLSIFRKVFPS